MWGCLSCTPYWGPGPQPRHVPWMGIGAATPCFSGQHSVHWATPGRADINNFLPKPQTMAGEWVTKSFYKVGTHTHTRIYTYMVCPESIQPCSIKNRDIYCRRCKKHCTYNNDTSVPFKVGTSGPHTVLPNAISCPVIFSCISSMVWNLSPFKGDFSFGKSQQSQGAKFGRYGVLSHLGDLMFHQKTTRHDTWVDRCVVVMKLPITSCPELQPSESSEQFPEDVQA